MFLVVHIFKINIGIINNNNNNLQMKHYYYYVCVCLCTSHVPRSYQKRILFCLLFRKSSKRVTFERIVAQIPVDNDPNRKNGLQLSIC